MSVLSTWTLHATVAKVRPKQFEGEPAQRMRHKQIIDTFDKPHNANFRQWW